MPWSTIVNSIAHQVLTGQVQFHLQISLEISQKSNISSMLQYHSVILSQSCTVANRVELQCRHKVCLLHQWKGCLNRHIVSMWKQKSQKRVTLQKMYKSSTMTTTAMYTTAKQSSFRNIVIWGIWTQHRVIQSRCLLRWLCEFYAWCSLGHRNESQKSL